MTKTIYLNSKTQSHQPTPLTSDDTKTITFNTPTKNLITVEQLRERLQNYKRIFDFEHLSSVQPGTWVKYIIIHTKEYKSGGLLIKNNFPDKFVFKNPKSQFVWSVKLSDKAFFISDKDKMKASREKSLKEKNELHNLYKQGKLQIKK